MKAPILEGILHPITKTVLFHQRISHTFLKEGGKISILPFLIHLSEKKKKPNPSKVKTYLLSLLLS